MTPNSCLAAAEEGWHVFMVRVAALMAVVVIVTGCGRGTGSQAIITYANTVKISVDRSGFYRITMRELQEAGGRRATLR